MRAETKDSPTEATSSSASAAALGTPIAEATDTSINEETPWKKDEASFARVPAETHSLDTEAEETQVSKKARTAQLVLHERGMQEGQTGKEEMRQQQTIKVMDDITKENQVEGKNGCKPQLVGL